MSDEQKNVDDGKRWQVDYDCNLVWEQTSKSNTNLNELKKLFGYAERFYDILPSSFEKSDGPYYKIILKPKDNWSSIPDMDDNLKRNFYEDTQEINVAFLTISNDTRENNKKGKEKIISSNLKNHINSIKLRCQGNLYYENLKNKVIIARYSYKQNEDIDLIIMDVLMPVIDGITASKIIRQTERGKNIVIIMMTANSYIEDEEGIEEAAINYHITKPFERREVVDILVKEFYNKIV